MICTPTGNRRINRSRIFFIFIVLAISSIITYRLPIDLIISKDILSIAITVFPVLFGFSITIIAIAGGLDGVLMGLSWKRLAMYKRTFENKMLRQAMLGIGYLSCLVLAVFLKITPVEAACYVYFGKAFIFMSVLAVSCSFSMPFLLYTLHSEKYAQLMQEKGAP